MLNASGIRPTVPFLCALLVVLLVLGGCATTPGPILEDHPDWELAGRIGVRGPDFSRAASINWRQWGPRFDVRLTGFAGAASARLEGSSAAVTLWRNGEPPQRSEDPEGLLQAQLGWSVPVDGLSYWARGRVIPGVALEGLETGDRQRPERFQQAGWQVEVRWDEEHQLPRRVDLERGEVRVRLVIREWLRQPGGR